MLSMSHIRWPADVEFRLISLEPEDRVCAHCGARTSISDDKHRYLRSLGRPLHVLSKVCCCPDKACAGHAEKRASELEMSIAPPYWSVSWDLFAWMGHRRFSRHWSVPQICAELLDRYGVWVSEDVAEDYTAKYEVMVAARESDLDRLVAEYQGVTDLMLSIDGLQPEKGHETLYVVRELRQGRVWFAEPLLSSAAGEVQGLLERARDIAARIGKPIRSWMSDKQDAFVSGIKEVFPGTPHRYCANHFLRDAAKPMLEVDSHAKVQMRRKVRGLRKIERQMLEQQGERKAVASAKTASPAAAAQASDEQEAPAVAQPSNEREAPTAAAQPSNEREAPIEATGSGEAGQVVLDYCATVRGILNNDQGGPLHPPGVRMAEALDEVRDSIRRVQVVKKGGSTSAP
jgi:hypothetical protein